MLQKGIFLISNPGRQKLFIGILFLQVVDISKNKRNRKQQKYDLYLTKLITHDEISPFDGTVRYGMVPILK
jgi:hypothetical protein